MNSEEMKPFKEFYKKSKHLINDKKFFVKIDFIPLSMKGKIIFISKTADK